MRKVLVFGNSGSGKSTLARALSAAEGLAHLDLDTLAWQPTTPPQRKPVEESAKDIAAFIRSNKGWVIEGCYTDLLELALPAANEMTFLNLPVDACIANAKARPWEPHKYKSKEAQDANLEMLTHWIAQYAERNDTFSKAAHTNLYNQYTGKKQMYTNNKRNTL